MRQLVLPDDLTVFSLNPDETRFVHREVFESRCYLRNGIELRDGDCVFDVGANIGLSALFFHRERKGVKVFAFEPSPAASKCLRANTELHGLDARIFECGLSRTSGSAEFTFYPGNTILSGFHANPNTDRNYTRAYLLNSGFTPQNADRLAGLLFRKVTLTCQLRTLSEIVDQEHVDRIDLLKIDTEKSEQDVLAGIRDEHWNRIRQIVIEIHDETGALDVIQRQLTHRGFLVTVEQDPMLQGTRLFDLFGTRPN
ncbi:MAG TPA: FkbM family methyltransferase [Terracidiphilus sp.]|jgi:FkbM family methyltransferase